MSETLRDDAAEKEALTELRSMIGDAGVRPAAIAGLLDGLATELRAPVVRGLGRKHQQALYARAEGHASLELIDIVPPNRGDLEEVRHLGRNSLPAFKIFEKRFCRLPGNRPDAPETLAGYNFQAMSPVTGPGYFVARDDTKTREVLVDYHLLPDQKPSDWPPIRSNERGLSRFVYGFMIDRLRRVSKHVTIGSAARNGRDLGSYFVLNRAD
jgi:hypothetical protein